ncbi:MAG: pyridoxamine 5'-phosphate oxidase family protein [Deltaproteobacteria bacterium]|nr:pyridoxamine 5'-phosphate oxidase family protein [Deltaproteobacteria bacterium]
MKLSEYFENTKGRGVIATADSKGKVGAAIFGRPHFINEKTVAFIMADRLMHKNLKSNPYASYLFMESGERYKGKRLCLTKIKEEKDPDLIKTIRRKEGPPPYKDGQTRYLVYFKITKILPLIGEKTKG